MRNFSTDVIAILTVVSHKPSEVYMRLITASYKVGSGTKHMCVLEICMWSLQILESVDGCVFHNCGEPAISLHSHTVSLVQWVNPLLHVMTDPGSIPRGYSCETGILLLVLSRYIGDPDMIDHCALSEGASSRTITRPLCRQCDNPT